MPELLGLKVFFFFSFFLFISFSFMGDTAGVGGMLLSLYTVVYRSMEKTLQET